MRGIIRHLVSDGKMHCLFLHQEFPDLQDNKTCTENIRLPLSIFKISVKFISNFLALAGSFAVKNDKIHSFVPKFGIYWLCSKTKSMDWTISMETVGTVGTTRPRLRKNQSEHTDLP